MDSTCAVTYAHGKTLTGQYVRPSAAGGENALSDDILEFRDVTIRFNDETIYQDLSFGVRPGEFLCILGPSGCGKSTSLRVMGDLIPVDEGTVTVEGEPAHAAWSKLAYVFQQPRLVPWRTALANVTLGMELRFERGSKSQRSEKARALLDMVGLGRDAEKYPSMLSGGERQRVAIARALSVDPHIILMDEPFSALDLNTRQRLRTEIIAIWRNTGKTVIFVTHDIDEALVLADRVLLLSDKPTRVLETIEIDAPRPRVVETTPTLRQHKEHLIRLFRTLERRDDGAPQDGPPDGRTNEETSKDEQSRKEEVSL